KSLFVVGQRLGLIAAIFPHQRFDARLGLFQLLAAGLAQFHAAREKFQRPVERQIARLQLFHHFLQFLERAFKACHRAGWLLTFGHSVYSKPGSRLAVEMHRSMKESVSLCRKFSSPLLSRCRPARPSNRFLARPLPGRERPSFRWPASPMVLAAVPAKASNRAGRVEINRAKGKASAGAAASSPCPSACSK